MAASEFKVPSKSIADLIDGVLTDDDDDLYDHRDVTEDTPSSGDGDLSLETGGGTLGWDMDAELDEVMDTDSNEQNAEPATPPQNELMMYVDRRVHRQGFRSFAT